MMDQKCEKQLEKLVAIKKINLHQIDIVKKMTEMALKPSSPYPKVNRRRTFSIIGMGVELRACAIQIDIIKAQPVHDFTKGGVVLGANIPEHEL